MSEINWQERAEKAERACAEMRHLFLSTVHHQSWCKAVSTYPARYDECDCHDLGDAGKDYVPRSELDALQANYDLLRANMDQCRELAGLGVDLDNGSLDNAIEQLIERAEACPNCGGSGLLEDCSTC